MCPPTITDEVALLAGRGLAVELVEVGGQWYVLVKGIDAPSPPWDRGTFDILIAIPTAYDAAALDAFYLGLPYQFNSGGHPRANGAVIECQDRKWQLVSWHYPDGGPWQRGQDDLDSHITHCRGFFWHRGAVNDFR